MAKVVGFAESPKPPAGSQLVEISADLEVASDRDVTAATLFGKASASSWLGTFSKYELSLGGKVLFEADARAPLTFTEVNLPKSVALIGEAFGELQFSLAKAGSATSVHLRFSRWVLPEDREVFEQTTTDLIEAIAEATKGVKHGQ
jgi:hypothetical protein